MAKRHEWHPGAGMVETGRMIANGDVSSREVCETYLEAIRQQQHAGSIYCHVTAERGLREAAASDDRHKAGKALGPLDGVPISWKDLFDTAGDPVESGAPLLRGRVPERDAEVVRLAAGAGLVCLGKTHQTEFAFSGLGINPNTATPPNRDFPGHVPGGSSSGAAASLTHGLAAGAIGSDTGGSVRIPAAWNSLVGMKTSHGLVSNEGVVPLCPGFDTVGPIVRSVEDASLLTEVLAGGKLKKEPVPEPSSLRLAIADGIAFEDCDGEVLAAFDDAVNRIAASGVNISRIVPKEFAEALRLGASIFPFEAWQQWGDLISSRPGVMYPPVERRFRQGACVEEADYRKALARLDELRRAFEAETSEFDMLILPSVAILPRPVDALLADADVFTATNLLALRNTRFSNLFGNCALTLPTPEKGCGFMLMGKPMQDGRLLAAGAALEAMVRG